MAATIRLQVIADTGQATSGLNKVAGDTQKFGAGFKSTFSALLASKVVQKVASTVWKFGQDSVAAYQKSEQNAVKYGDAMKRLPDASAATTKALTGQAKALANVTTYSAGTTKSAQAVLAGFNLTSAQIKQAIPLIQDYATKTGKDLPTAAQDFGKATLGQARAFKVIGLNITAASASQKQAAVVARQYSAAVKAQAGAADHLRVVQAAIASGQLKGKSAASSLTSAQMRLAERTTAAGRAHAELSKAQSTAGKGVSTYSQLITGLQSKVGGLATEMGTTTAGKMQIMNNKVTALKVSLGQQLAPAITAVVNVGLSLLNFIKNNIDVLLPLAVAVVAIVAVIKIWTTYTKALTAAQVAYNAVMAANPILLIIIGIIALIAVLVIAYQKVGWFRDIVNAAWSAIRTVFTVYIAIIKAQLNILMTVVTAVGRAFVAAWKTVSTAVSTGAAAVIAFIAPLVGRVRGILAPIVNVITLPWQLAFGAARALVTGGISGLISYIAGIPGRVGAALSGLGHAISGPFQAAFNAVKNIVAAALDWVSSKIASVTGTVTGAIQGIKAVYNAFARTWNGIEVSITVPSNAVTKALKLAGQGFTFATPKLPLLASGGYVTRATLAVVGEGGGGEIVAPVPMLRRVIQEEMGSRDVTVNINVNVPDTANPAETGRAVATVLRSYFAAGGRLAVPA